MPQANESITKFNRIFCVSSIFLVYYFCFPFLFYSFKSECETVVVCCALNSWNVNQIVSLMWIHIQTLAQMYTQHSVCVILIRTHKYSYTHRRAHLHTLKCVRAHVLCLQCGIHTLVYVYYIFWHILKRRRKKTTPMYWHQQTFMCWPRYERRNRPTEVFNRFIFANFQRFKGCVSAKKVKSFFSEIWMKHKPFANWEPSDSTFVIFLMVLAYKCSYEKKKKRRNNYHRFYSGISLTLEDWSSE